MICPTTPLQAALKPVTRIQRYEALPHREVTLELALSHFAMGKYVKLPSLLVQVSAAASSLHLGSAGCCW